MKNAEQCRKAADQSVLHECCNLVQGPTISPVYSVNQSANGAEAVAAERGFFAATICVPKARLYTSVKDLRAVSSSVPSCASKQCLR